MPKILQLFDPLCRKARLAGNRSTRRGAGGGRDARGVDGFLDAHAVVDEVECDLEHRVDDGGAAGGTVGGDGLIALEQHGR